MIYRATVEPIEARMVRGSYALGRVHGCNIIVPLDITEVAVVPPGAVLENGDIVSGFQFDGRTSEGLWSTTPVDYSDKWADYRLSIFPLEDKTPITMFELPLGDLNISASGVTTVGQWEIPTPNCQLEAKRYAPQLFQGKYNACITSSFIAQYSLISPIRPMRGLFIRRPNGSRPRVVLSPLYPKYNSPPKELTNGQ